MPQSTSDWITLFLALGAFIGYGLEYFKSKHTGLNLDSDTIKNYTALLDRAAKKEKEYQDLVDTFDTRIAEVEKKAVEANARADRFENWAKRLAGQVVSMGGTPVGLEPGKVSGV